MDKFDVTISSTFADDLLHLLDRMDSDESLRFSDLLREEIQFAARRSQHPDIDESQHRLPQEADKGVRELTH